MAAIQVFQSAVEPPSFFFSQAAPLLCDPTPWFFVPLGLIFICLFLSFLPNRIEMLFGIIIFPTIIIRRLNQPARERRFL
jgi:hypothetical protein